MKKNVNNFMYLSIFLLTLLFSTTSCKKDEMPDRDQFIGTYSVSEICDTSEDSYDLFIRSSSSGEDAVLVINLFNAGGQMDGFISGNSLTLPSQSLEGFTFTGNGTLANNLLNLDFRVSDGTSAANCSASGAKR